MKKSLSYLLVLSLLLSCIMTLPVYSSKATQIQSGELALSSLSGENAKNVIFAPGKDSSSYHFTWEAVSDGDEYIQYAVSQNVVDREMPDNAYSVTATIEATKRGFTARAYVKNLNENTEYSYRVGSDSAGWSEIYTFKTSYNDGAFSFLLAGDPQIGATSTAYDAKNWNTTLDNAKSWFGDDIEFLMTAGDQVNVSSTHEQYEGFMSHSWLRSIPTVTTVGNHDNGSVYSNYYTYSDVDSTTLSSAGSYGGDYWIAYDSALIMSLNFNNTSVAVHEAFMESAINNFTTYYGEPTWIIAVFHQPIYSQGVRAEEAFTIAQRDLLAPVMSELGVDVVLTGHDHVYTRAYMMNSTTVKNDASLYTPVSGDDYGSIYDPDEGDVFYLTANSASGSKYYSLNSNVMPFTCVSSKEHVQTLTKVDVTWDSISFTTYRTSEVNTIADTLDFFAIHKSTDDDYYAPTLNVPSTSYFAIDEDIDFSRGITAYDNVDGDITSSVTYDAPSSYTDEFSVKYHVEDSSGNVTEKECRYIPYNIEQKLAVDDFVWSYLDDGTDPYGETNDLYSWATANYDVSSWKTGYGPLGACLGAIGNHAGYTPVTLLNQYYPEGHESAGSNIPQFFLRTTFDLKDPAAMNIIKGELRYDDGCNIFINGVKIAGFNTGKVTNGLGYSKTNSSSNAAYGAFNITDRDLISSLELKEKGNVLAVALYQSTSTSSDIFFKLSSLDFGSALYDPSLNTDGLALTVNDIKGAKDFFIAKGKHTTYREVKNNLVVHISSTKLAGKNNYTYLLSSPGDHTVYIRYSDAEKPDMILYTVIKVTEPTFTGNGLQLTIGNLDSVKVIRTAYGEYKTAGEIKREEGSRSFSANTVLENGNEYMIQYRKNGTVTVAVVYQNGYNAIYYYDVIQKTPAVVQDENTVTFTSLDGLKVLRYAKGEFSTSSEIKRAEGSVALTSAKIVNGAINICLEPGRYTFCVQYDDESYNYYLITV